MSQQSDRQAGGNLAVVAAGGSILLLPLSLLQFVGWSYPLELLTHFQVQYFLVAILVAVVLAGLRRWRWLPLPLGAMVISGLSLLPYQALHGSAAAHAAPIAQPAGLRVLLANVHYQNRRHDLVADLVASADADVLIFQEVNAAWMQALEPLAETYPYVVSRPREDAFGVVLFSRLPLDQSRLISATAHRPCIAAAVDVGGATITVVTTHPLNPLSHEWFQLRNRQLDQVAGVVAGIEGPVALLGDLNTTMWSPWYRRLCRTTGLDNARRGLGVLPSWPTYLPSMMRLPIDHCLINDEVEVEDVRLGADIGSDHFPLIVDLAVERSQ